MTLKSENGEKTPLYQAWRDMRRRCNNSLYWQYVDYGGRGIKVCERWNEFENFAADMGPHPGKGWTLDRKDNNAGYSKENCQWATRTQQNRNSRRAILSLEKAEEIRRRCVLGHSGNCVALAREFGVDHSTIWAVAIGRSWTR